MTVETGLMKTAVSGISIAYVKKLQFIHTVNADGSKVIKRQ